MPVWNKSSLDDDCADHGVGLGILSSAAGQLQAALHVFLVCSHGLVGKSFCKSKQKGWNGETKMEVFAEIVCMAHFNYVPLSANMVRRKLVRDMMQRAVTVAVCLIAWAQPASAVDLYITPDSSLADAVRHARELRRTGKADAVTIHLSLAHTVSMRPCG